MDMNVSMNISGVNEKELYSIHLKAYSLNDDLVPWHQSKNIVNKPNKLDKVGKIRLHVTSTLSDPKLWFGLFILDYFCCKLNNTILADSHA